MIRFGIAICLAGALLPGGCVRRRKAPAVTVSGESALLRAAHVRVEIQPLGEVDNSGLQLPAVSPDGKWVVYLSSRSDRPIEREALFTGRGLETMALCVRPAAPGAAARVVCASGAAWPTFTADSRRLLFVAYGATGRCDLGIHDLAEGTTDRKSLGLAHMMMPAAEPAGDRVAVVAPGRQADTWRVHVADLAGGKVEAVCPPAEEGESQFWPQWTADGRIVYVVACGGRTSLAQWAPGRLPPTSLSALRLPAALVGLHQSFAAVSGPLSPDGARWACYEPAQDRIVLVSLADGARIELPAGTQAGCWLGAARYVAAGGAEMRLFEVSTASPSVRLMRGAWLPSGATPAGELPACTRGSHPGVLELVRMKVLAGK